MLLSYHSHIYLRIYPSTWYSGILPEPQVIRKSSPWKGKVISEEIYKQTKGKKAVLVVLITLAGEAENKTTEELANEIREALEGDLARIPWLAVENVIIVEE